MFKVVFFLWRREDYDRDRFIDYYENRHAVLSYRLIPQPLDFRRNYPLWDESCTAKSRACVFGMEPFDVMTELFHAERGGFAAQVSTVTQSPAKELMAEDELNFLNRNRQVLLICEELGGNGAASAPTSAVKLIRFSQRSGTAPSEQFPAAYEKDAAPALAQSLSGIIEYRRSYPLHDDPMSYAGNWHVQGRPDPKVFPLDLIEEFWLSETADVQKIRQVLNAPHALLDSLATRTVAVDERRSDTKTPMAPIAMRPALAAAG